MCNTDVAAFIDLTLDSDDDVPTAQAIRAHALEIQELFGGAAGARAYRRARKINKVKRRFDRVGR